VTHTIGPVWRGGSYVEAESLANCYRNALRLASEHRVSTIAFPSISTGVYRYPIDKASQIAVGVVRGFLSTDDAINEVRVVCFDERTYDAYSKALRDEDCKRPLNFSSSCQFRRRRRPVFAIQASCVNIMWERTTVSCNH